MKRNTKCLVWPIYILAMLVLILDSETSITGTRDGINLCLQSVIPSLMPFIFLSGMLTASLSEIKIPNLALCGRLLRIPSGSELLVLLGFLGGYPVGAQNICDAHRSGLIKKDTAKRMLVFCNNAGPAFIFGIVTPQFTKPELGWVLWGILIFSSLITALLLPGDSEVAVTLKQTQRSAPQVLMNTVKAMGGICGWVIIFRVFLGFAEQCLLYQLPSWANALISGLLELTNGCVQLKNIKGEFAQFAISAALLSVGGLCVTMQTASAAADLGIQGYLPGKILQGCISYILCLMIRPIVFPDTTQFQFFVIGSIVLIIAVLCLIYLKYNKECSRFSRKSIVYCQHRSL